MENETQITQKMTVEVTGTTGVLTLTRPKALNALDLEMYHIIDDALTDWENDPAVEQVLIVSGIDRAFCAGGDIRIVAEHDARGDHDYGDHALRVEYDMNAHLARFPKPIVTIVNGLCMGGGLGVTVHNSHRIITEKAWMSMPEMNIGYCPDVGVTWQTQRLHTRAVAAFMGITGYRFTPGDCLWAGLGTHFVASAALPQFTESLLKDGVDQATALYATTPPEAELTAWEAEIEQVFSHDTWAEMAAELEQTSPEFQEFVHGLIQQANPSSIVATAELYRANAAAPTVQAGLDNEWRLGSVLRRESNFPEGVRAVLVDKDQTPHFVPATVEQVDPQPYRDALR